MICSMAEPLIRLRPLLHHPTGTQIKLYLMSVCTPFTAQCGMAVAFGLMRERVTNVLCLDENEEGKEGPWVTYARMVTLRTPKTLTGIDYGMACLTFQVRLETVFGCSWFVGYVKAPDQV